MLHTNIAGRTCLDMPHLKGMGSKHIAFAAVWTKSHDWWRRPWSNLEQHRALGQNAQCKQSAQRTHSHVSTTGVCVGGALFEQKQGYEQGTYLLS